MWYNVTITELYHQVLKRMILTQFREVLNSQFYAQKLQKKNLQSSKSLNSIRATTFFIDY